MDIIITRGASGGQLIIARLQVRLLVFDEQESKVLQWIN
jgi:hypothetical protein